MKKLFLITCILTGLISFNIFSEKIALIDYYHEAIKYMDLGSFNKFKKLSDENSKIFSSLKKQLIIDAKVRLEGTQTLEKITSQERPLLIAGQITNKEQSGPFLINFANLILASGTIVSTVNFIQWLECVIYNRHVINANTIRTDDFNKRLNEIDPSAAGNQTLAQLATLQARNQTNLVELLLIMLPTFFTWATLYGFGKLLINDTPKNKKELEKDIIAFLGHTKFIQKKIINLQKIISLLEELPDSNLVINVDTNLEIKAI